MEYDYEITLSLTPKRYSIVIKGNITLKQVHNLLQRYGIPFISAKQRINDGAIIVELYAITLKLIHFINAVAVVLRANADNW